MKKYNPPLDGMSGKVTLQMIAHRNGKITVVFCNPPQYLGTNSNEDNLSVSQKGQERFYPGVDAAS